MAALSLLAPGASLSSYSLSRPEGYYPYSDVYLGVRKACADSNKLINVSQGFWTYESDPASEMEDCADTIAELHKAGCLIIKAAGNDAFDRKLQDFVAEDSVLHVEAASVSRSLSKFSSNGEVRAPGSLIVSIKPIGTGPQSCESMQYPATVSSGKGQGNQTRRPSSIGFISPLPRTELTDSMHPAAGDSLQAPENYVNSNHA